MTTKATDNQWAQVKSWAALGSSRDACVCDLQQQVQELGLALDQLRINYLRLANATAHLAPDRIKFFAGLMPDGEEEAAQ
jgi:hypothetical protein